VPAADIKKLKESGYHTCQSLMMSTKKELTSIRGVSDAKVEKFIEAVMKMIPDVGFMTGTVALHKRQKHVLHVTTGCEALDAILDGGIETQSITEFYGEHRTGKSQICHTLAVTAQLPREMGGASGKVAWIDTEGTFRPERIVAVAERFGLDGEAVLENIAVARAFTYEHQQDLLVAIASKMAEEPFKLLIIGTSCCVAIYLYYPLCVCAYVCVRMCVCVCAYVCVRMCVCVCVNVEQR